MSEQISFETRLETFIQNLEVDTPATETKPVVFKFKQGVTPEKLQKDLGFAKKTSYTVGIGQMRDFVRFESMIVDYNGKKLTGQELRKELGLARGKFIDYCKENTKGDVEKPAFKVVKQGIELPKFRTRSTQVPDALSMLSSLTESVQPEAETETETEAE